MENKAFKPITIHPKAVYTGGGVIEVLAGVELSKDDVSILVQTTLSYDPFMPVFLLMPGGWKQRLSFDQLEQILAEPLRERRAILAIEQAAEAARKEREWQEMEATRKKQEQQQATKEAAQRPTPEPAIG